MITRSPSLTEKTKQHIKERILNNEFSDGRIPSETELAQALGVSRTTVRDALSKLENEGFIIRKQGVGTFINQPGLQVKTRLDEIWSYEAALRAHGYTPEVQVLSIQQEPASARAASRLHIEPGEPVVIIAKRFLEDATPAILTRNVIPAALLHCQPDATNARQPIYELLENCGHQRLSYYLSDILPVVAEEDVAAQLEIPVGTPLLAFDEIGYDADNQPLLWARSWFRDDRIRFRLMRRRI